MKTLYLAIILVFVVSITSNSVFAQNVTNSTNSTSNTISTPNGGWITPLQTTNSSGGKLNMHVEQGVDVSGKIMPPPVTPNMESPQQFQTPLHQFKSGIKAENVKCTDGFTLVIKSEDGSPACVKPDTANILIKRGWAESITSGMSQTSNPLPKGAQVDLTNVSVWTCGAGQKIATFVDTSGFVNITKANEPNKGLPVDWNDFFDFVLKPNSTGYIDMSFEFFGESYGVDNKQYNGSIQSSIGLLSQYGTISNAFNKTAIYTLDDPNIPHTSNLNGLHIFTTNIENVTNHTLKITYVIKVDSSAKEGTYGIGIPYTCPLELLTVGDHPYTGSIPWHRGTY